MSQGDNLQDAQAFSGLCDATLSRLVESESYIVTTKDEKVYVLSALDTIQLEAKRVHARAISRATQTAIEGVQDLRDTKYQVRNLRDLMHLVRQYQSGLEELTSKDPIPTQTPQPIADEHTVFEAAERPSSQSSNTLALNRTSQPSAVLVNWRPNVQDDMSFDHVMPALSDEILRAARTFNKSVSVSYAADEISMAPNFYHELSDTVVRTAVWLVEHAIKSPEHRLGQGLGQSAHIALTARKVDNCVNVLMSCDGEILDPSSIQLPHIGNLSQSGGTLTCKASEGVVRVEISGLNFNTVEKQSIRFGDASDRTSAEQIA